MGFGPIEQLIARGQPSPITSALQGFQTGAQMMPGIRMAQLAPALRQAQTQLALAKAQQAQAAARTAGQAKEPDILRLYQSYQQSFTQNPHSAQTRVLAAALQKALQKSQGITQTTTPEGTTTLQIGGSAAGVQPTATQIAPGEVLHPTHEAQANQQMIDAQQQQLHQIFPPQATAAQIADQKQLGTDLKTVGAAAETANNTSIPLFRKLRKAAFDLKNISGPVVGGAAWATDEGRRFQTLIGQAAKQIMSTVHNMRNQRELNLIISGLGNVHMHSSVIVKALNDGLDEQYQHVLEQDFLNNYMKQGGKSASEGKNLWAKMLTPKGIAQVPDKYLNFNVSGTNRNYKDYIKTLQNLIKKNPNNKALQNFPLVSLIREDRLGGQQ